MSRPILTGAEREAFERFPAEISDPELGAYFTLTDGELAALGRLRSEQARVAVGLGIGALRWLGFVPEPVGEAPAAARLRVAGQLSISRAAGAGGEMASPRTQRRHRAQAATLAGFRDAETSDHAELGRWLSELALEHDSPSYLLREALARLRAAQMIRPGLTVLERLVAAARAQAARDTHVRLSPQLSEPRRSALDGLLVVELARRTSALTWVGADARGATPEQIVEQLDKLALLRELGAEDFDLATIPLNRARLLARIARRSTTNALERREESVRYPALLAFCSDGIGRLTDEVVDLFDQAIGQGHARARRELERRKLADARSANEKVHILRQVLAVINDSSVPDGEVRRRVFERFPRERLLAAAEDAAQIARPLDDSHFACHRWPAGRRRAAPARAARAARAPRRRARPRARVRRVGGSRRRRRT